MGTIGIRLSSTLSSYDFITLRVESTSSQLPLNFYHPSLDNYFSMIRPALIRLVTGQAYLEECK